MGNTCEIHAKYMFSKKYMGNTCEIHAKYMFSKNSWEIHGKYMRNTLYCVTLYTNEVVLN